MPNKTRKPAKPAKPSKPVHRVRLTEQATPTKKGKPDTANAENIRPVRRRRIRQAAGGQVRGRRQRTAGQGRRGPAPAACRSHRRPTWPPSRPSCRPAGCTPTVGDWCPISRIALYLDLVAENLVDLPSTPRPDPTARDVPGSWDEIAPGHLVIAKESQECGWWEATVVERNGDLVTLRYLDYPHCPAFVRHRSAVALISLGAK